MSNLMVRLFYKPKYIVIFLRMHQNSLYAVRRFQTSNPKKLLNGGNKQYALNVNNPNYIKDNLRYYFIEYDKGQQILFDKNEFTMSNDELDTIVGNKIIRELARGVMDDKKTKITWFILGAICGLLLGLSIMLMVMNNKITKIYQDFQSSNLPTVFP